MAIPLIYQGQTPVPPDPSLSPLQLALASYMFQGSPPPFFINQEFLEAMKVLSDSKPLSLTKEDYITGLPKPPDVSPGIDGLAYISLGDDVFVYRKAPDCGPNENRFDNAQIGKLTEIATGSFQYYGGPIINGTVSRGSGDFDYVYNSGGSDG